MAIKLKFNNEATNYTDAPRFILDSGAHDSQSRGFSMHLKNGLLHCDVAISNAEWKVSSDSDFVRFVVVVCLSRLQVCISVCLPICLSVCQYVCLSFCLPICLSVCLSANMSVCQYVCLSVSLSANMSVCLSFWLPICLSVCPLKNETFFLAGVFSYCSP